MTNELPPPSALSCLNDSSFNFAAASCAGSLVCIDSKCQCPPGTDRDRVLWYAPVDTCGLNLAGIQATYIVSSTLSVLVAILNYREYRRIKPGPARTAFALSWLWLLALCSMNIAHWAEGYFFGPVTVTALIAFQQLSVACLCLEMYHVIGPMMLLTRRTGARQKGRMFIYVFLGTWITLNSIAYIVLMFMLFHHPDKRNEVVLGIYNYFLIEFILNALLAYVSIRRFSREILAVRSNLMQLPHIGAHRAAATVLQFYSKVSNVFILVLVHIVFILVFIVALNACYLLIPEYGWPFYSVSVIAYPALGLVPLIFWYTGGRVADDFATDMESSVAESGAVVGLRT